MLHVGLDLSRRRLDICVLDGHGELVAETAVPADADGLRGLAQRLAGRRVRAVIESMNGARFVHDKLESRLGGVDRRRAEGQGAGAAGVQDRQDRRQGAGRAVAGAIWCRRSGCPTRAIRRERERARFRLHLVRHRTTLKNRIHATLITFGHPCPVSDLFGSPAASCSIAWRSPTRGARNVDVSLGLIDDLELQIAAADCRAQAHGRRSPLHPAAGHRPGVRVDQRVHRRLGDRRHRPLRRRRPSCAATPACARGSSSPATSTVAARSPSTAPSTCAGR